MRLVQPLKWHGDWSVFITDIRCSGTTTKYCWCKCRCGISRLVSQTKAIEPSSRGCGCSAHKASSIRRSQTTGNKHANWLGGHWNRGTEAWARKIIRAANHTSKKGNYLPSKIKSHEIVRLFANFSGSCPICNEKVDKWNGRKLCLDHDHITGRVRGFICHHCNACLGWLESYEINIISHREE